MTLPTCKDCAIWHLNGNNICPMLKIEVKETDTCPFHQSSLSLCEICGRQVVGATVLDIEGDEVHSICRECAEAGSSCQTCSHGKSCAFQTDTSCKEPPMVMRTVRQGNMTMQTQVKNPARVIATCYNCPCFDKDAEDPNEGCRKNRNYCQQYHITYRR